MDRPSAWGKRPRTTRLHRTAVDADIVEPGVIWPRGRDGDRGVPSPAPVYVRRRAPARVRSTVATTCPPRRTASSRIRSGPLTSGHSAFGLDTCVLFRTLGGRHREPTDFHLSRGPETVQLSVHQDDPQPSASLEESRRGRHLQSCQVVDRQHSEGGDQRPRQQEVSTGLHC